MAEEKNTEKKPAAKKAPAKKAVSKTAAKTEAKAIAPAKNAASKATTKPAAKKPAAKAAPKGNPTGSTLTVRLIKSPIGAVAKQHGTVRGLGLRKVGSESTLEDTPAVRGMVRKIQHMVQVVSQ